MHAVLHWQPYKTRTTKLGMTDSIFTFTAQHEQLSSWQANRLAATYRDLLDSERYSKAAQFFLTDLYGPYDTSERDSKGEKVIQLMEKILPDSAIRPMEEAMELNRLTKRLDDALCKMLFDTMQVTKIDAKSYCEAYRRCDNYSLRLAQIEMVEELGLLLDRVVKKPFVHTALKLAHGPAHLAGLGALQDFLERGFSAFLHMKGAADFMQAIKTREAAILDRIFAGDPDPFRTDFQAIL